MEIIAQGNIWFPFFETQIEAKRHNFLIKTTTERLDDFCEHINDCNRNFWIEDEYIELCEDITKFAARIVFESQEYCDVFKTLMWNSPYGFDYKL